MNKTYVSVTQGSHWFLCLHVFIAFTEGNCFPVLFISVFLTKALVLQQLTPPILLYLSMLLWCGV